MLVFLSLLAFMQSYAHLIYFSYFAQNSTGSCERCHKSCKECMGPQPMDCLSCNTYFYLLHSTKECVSSCPQYYYENKDNNVCERCHPSCLTCEGKSICSAFRKKGVIKTPGISASGFGNISQRYKPHTVLPICPLL